jgi:carboxyl-terminal processing protease
MGPRSTCHGWQRGRVYRAEVGGSYVSLAHQRNYLERLNMRSLLVPSALCLGLLAGCGGGGDDSGSGSGAGGIAAASGYPSSPSSCDTAGQRAWLRDYMNDQYFWYNKQGVPNEAATTTSDYLASLLNKPIDRYSFAQSTASADQFFVEGKRTGYGYALAFADAAQTILKVRLVEPLSPVAAAGLQRSDTIVSIDGKTPAEIASGALAVVSTEGVDRSFVVTNAAGVRRSFTVKSSTFTLSPVISSRVLTAANGAKTGYLMYQEFISTGAVAMGAAFDSFRAAGVTELVLDLRYNGGGSTLEARNLASLIGGASVGGKVFANYRFSDKKSAGNFTQNFSTTGLPGAALQTLSRVFVITSNGTASASELVINALRPFKTVVTIGDTTFGKPFAFQPRSACAISYNAVNIEIANADNFADYSAGFAATCPMSDDLTKQLGDPAELRTAAALSYITTGACPPVAQSNNAGAATKIGVNGARVLDLGLGEMSPRQMRVD